MQTKPLIWVRGAGELGSAVALTLHRVGFPVILTERGEPWAIRRPVTFSDAVFDGESQVEEVTAVRCEPGKATKIQLVGHIPLLVTEGLPRISAPIQGLVDARMLKDSRVQQLKDIPWCIGLGPGFEVGKNCDAIIETQRGHDLGRILWFGAGAADTGIPGELGGVSKQRVVYSPAAGSMRWQVKFGDVVQSGTVLGYLNDAVEVRAPSAGLVRGLISPRVWVPANVKIADVDPRGSAIAYQRISEKARGVGRGVLEALLILENQTK